MTVATLSTARDIRREAAREIDAMAEGIISAHNALYHPGRTCPDYGDDTTCAESARAGA